MPEATPKPKVFLSHASEDKERFVLGFALALRRRGVDIWLDRWEMLPGDSLVDKIFAEGLRQAAAVIVVISSNSAGKRWVREELNAAFVKRVNEGGLLIPVVLDEVDVPEALRSTIWEPIHDVNAYDESLNRIVSAIFGHSSRPPLGDPPKYAVPGLPKIHGLADTDVVVLREFGALAIETGNWIIVDTETVWIRVSAFDVSRSDFLDALKILSDRRWLEKARILAPVPPYFKVTVSGLEEYLTRFDPRYPELFRRVVAEIVNGGEEIENSVLAERLNEQKVIVDHVLRRLKDRRLADVSEAFGGHITVRGAHPELRRWLRR